MTGAEPERELIRRITPFALPAAAAAFGLGALIGGADDGWSAAIAIAIIALLRQLDWFSTVAFIAALVPATIALLVVEMRLLAGRMQAELWSFPAAARGVPR